MKRLIILGLVVALVTVMSAPAALFAMGGGNDDNGGNGGNGGCDKNKSSSKCEYPKKKVTICHKKKNTIRVSINALPAHQAHGDTTGPCKDNGKKDHHKKDHHKKDHHKKDHHKGDDRR